MWMSFPIRCLLIWRRPGHLTRIVVASSWRWAMMSVSSSLVGGDVHVYPALAKASAA